MSPFGYKRGEGIDAGAGEPEWIVNKERYKSDLKFEELGPMDGKITGAGELAFFFYTPSFNEFNEHSKLIKEIIHLHFIAETVVQVVTLVNNNVGGKKEVTNF